MIFGGKFTKNKLCGCNALVGIFLFSAVFAANEINNTQTSALDQSNSHVTPIANEMLITAATQNNLAEVGHLLQQGAVIDDKNKSGFTALDLAKPNHQTACVKILENTNRK